MTSKICIVSDTHGYIEEVLNFVLCDKPDFIIHAGDTAEDAKELYNLSGITTYFVKGNNDYDFSLPDEKLIYIENNRIYLTHGHKFGVYRGLKLLYKRAVDVKADIVIFGHTHEYLNKEIGGIRFLNPGSPSLPRLGEGSIISLSLPDLEVKKIIL